MQLRFFLTWKMLNYAFNIVADRFENSNTELPDLSNNVQIYEKHSRMQK